MEIMMQCVEKSDPVFIAENLLDKCPQSKMLKLLSGSSTKKVKKLASKGHPQIGRSKGALTYLAIC